MDIIRAYWQPVVQCKDRDRAHMPCADIVLPYPNLPGIGNDQPGWPPREWRTALACHSCGLVSVYSAWDVQWHRAPSEGLGQFRSDTVCFRVEGECGQGDCRSPTKWHTEAGDRSREGVDWLRAKIARGFFHGRCARGHALGVAPISRYRLTEELGPIPSDPSLTPDTAVPWWWNNDIDAPE